MHGGWGGGEEGRGVVAAQNPWARLLLPHSLWSQQKVGLA